MACFWEDHPLSITLFSFPGDVLIFDYIPTLNNKIEQTSDFFPNALNARIVAPATRTDVIPKPKKPSKDHL